MATTGGPAGEGGDGEGGGWRIEEVFANSKGPRLRDLP